MKKLMTLILALTLMLPVLPAYAAGSEAYAAAWELYEKGLFLGTSTEGDPEFELDRRPTRNEAVIMLVRLLGKEKEACAGTWDTPFTDVPAWAEPYVGYAYANGLTNGISDTKYGGSACVTGSQYITFVLRSLGYSSSTDFRWDQAWELSDAIGLTDGSYNAKNNEQFTRGDVAIVSRDSLTMQPSLSLGQVLSDAAAQRREKIESDTAFSRFKSWLKADKNTLTSAEVNALQSGKGSQSVSYAQAAADIELYFRTLKYAYGAYYYFGGDTAFHAAEAEALAAIEGKSTVTPTQLADAIRNSVDFVMDGHFSVSAPSIVENDNVKHVYFYCDLAFFEDDNGYYTLISGQKWYFSAFSDAGVSMEVTLTRGGRLIYSPVLMTTVTAAKNSTVTVTNGSQKKTLELNWTESTPFSEDYYRNTDFQLVEEDGIAYISLRSFDVAYEGELYQFAATGAEVKDADAVIIDLRGNGGGSDLYGQMWMESFTGRSVSLPEAFGYRSTALTNGELGSETVNEIYNIGRMIDNDVPVIVLVDNHCASAGESMLLYLMTLENALVVGSNSAGYQLCGNRQDLALPNSGVAFSFGVSLGFKFDTTNVDGVGYTPDVWCDPAFSLDAVLALLGSDMEIVHKENESIGGVEYFEPGSSRITMGFLEYTVECGTNFGTNSGTYDLTVYLDGKETSGFTFSNADDSVVSFQKAGGKLRMTIKGNGHSVLSVTAAGVTTNFGCVVMNYQPAAEGMVLGFQGRAVEPGGAFGYFTGMDSLDVILDGRRVTDFDWDFSKEGVAEILFVDGESYIRFLGNGSTKLTITADGVTETFNVVVNGFEDAGSPRITLGFAGAAVMAGQGFGSPTGSYELTVYLDGAATGNYTFDFEQNGVATCVRQGDKLLVTVVGRGNSMVTITAGGVSTTFRWASV